MIPKILLRKGSSLMDEEELEVAKKHFICLSSRMDVKNGDLIIPRYSLYPWAKEFIDDIHHSGAKTINSYSQSEYIANLKNWIIDVGDLTFRTWNRLDVLPENTAFVLKGESNSRKFEWKTRMFAANRQEAIRVHGELSKDGLIGSQEIYIREYVPLKKFLTGFQDLPITNEYRFFVAYGKIISGGFYWSNYLEDIKELGFNPDISQVPEVFLKEVIKRIGNNNNFYVVDVAETEGGEWIVVELNQGEQSGLSCNDPNVLYSALKLSIC